MRTTKEKLPAILLWIGEWVKDPQLSKCAPATRGIWIDAICAMHESDRSGKLSGTVEQLARTCRCTPSEMQAAIADLQATGAASIRETVTQGHTNVTLINRRMEREHKSRLAARKRKRLHRQRSDVTPASRESHAVKSIPSQFSPSGRGTGEERKRAQSDALRRTLEEAHAAKNGGSAHDPG